MNMSGKHKRFLARMLALGMAVSLCPAGNVFASAAGTAAVDMKVADRVYGWVTEAPVNNGDGSVTVGIVPAGQSGTKSYTTEKIYDITNKQLEGTDGINEADVLLVRLGYEVGRSGDMSFKPGVFAELCLNAKGQVIDARRVLQSGLFFDTAEYGGDLTRIGSTVEHRGVEGTGIMTGEAGDMVASGWVLAKADGTITLGDGNMATELFIEQYNVADDVKVYEVDNDTYASSKKTFADIPVTPAKDGVIYDTASEQRMFAVAVFDKDYTAYDGGSAKVSEIYYFKNAVADVSKYVGLVPSSNRIGSDLSTADQGSPKPSSAPFLTSSAPFAVVDGKMWSTGDNEALNYLFYATNSDGSYSLVRYDTGWPQSGYQYWKADEKALQASGIDLDSRDINQVLLSHGHADHYGTSFDLWEMIVRAGSSAKVFETYEDGVGYDKLGFKDTKGALPTSEYAFRATITDWYDMDQWLELGDGLACYPILTPGHTPGVASAVYQVTVGKGGMKDAHLTYDAETGERTVTDYKEGDELFFIYMGGYGINGLQSPSAGYLRPAFVSSLRYLQSVLPYLKTTTGQTADGIYNLPQHTNQFPYLEVQSMREMYNDKYGTDYSFLHFLREGAEEVSNFAEKRASAMLYQDYDEKYQKMYDDAGQKVPFMEIDGVQVKIDATNADPAKLFTVEESGPYKHEEGKHVIQIGKDTQIVVMHGYDPYLNKGGVEEGKLTNTASQGGSAKSDFDMNKGFLFAKDGFVTDPDAWYVQVCAHVMDDYDGNVYSNTGINAGSEFTSGPVESFHGEGWYEIIRTGAMTKAEAQALAASLKQGAYYEVELKKTGDIVNAEKVKDTFVLVGEDIGKAYEAGYAKQLPTVDYIIANYPKLDDYYGQYVEGYYAYNDFAVGDGLRDAHFYIPADSVFNQPTVFVGVPSSEKNPYNFLVKSGWKDLADEKGLYLITMEDGGDGWSEDDIAYIAQLASDVGKRPFFCTFESNFYAIAYGDAADILQKHSVDNPKTWAAIAIVGAEEGMTAKKVEELQNTDSKVPGVPKSEVQTPVWIVADSSANTGNIKRMVDFYRSANHSQETAAGKSAFAEEVYLPMEGGDVDNEWCANVAYDKDKYSDAMHKKAYAEAVYTELFEGVYRYPGDANGALRRPGEIFSRGFEYHEAEVPGGYYADGSDVYTREWYTYAPKSAQEKIEAGKKVPVVFVYHGAGGTGNEIADRSGWAKVADENGFIIVMPSASIAITPREINNKVFPDMRPAWNTGAATATRPSDLKLVRYIYNWLLTEYKYADSIDTTRIYASGQSSGGMMSWACAAELSDIFAAAAPVSATRALASDTADAMVPIIAFIGEEDKTFAGGFGSEDGKAAIDYWTERNNTVERWDDYSYMADDSKAPAPEGPGDKELFTNYYFHNKNGVPVLRCIEVATKTHAIWPSECFTAWNEFFVHYTKDADGAVCYDGVAADAWYYKAVTYVREKGIMRGINDGSTFAPSMSMTRAMMAQVMFNMEKGTAPAAGSFSDVAADAWYADAVNWAAANDIVDGYGAGKFGPEASITREQLAVLMYNYAKFKGEDVTATSDLSTFSDGAQVSDWANAAMQWAVAKDLINGSKNALNPLGTASRAEVAQILMNYFNK